MAGDSASPPVPIQRRTLVIGVHATETRFGVRVRDFACRYTDLGCTTACGGGCAAPEPDVVTEATPSSIPGVASARVGMCTPIPPALGRPSSGWALRGLQ